MSNKLEKTVEASAWVIMALLLIKFVPKSRIREAQVSFLFKQLITWLFGLLVVEKKLISYPKRLFFKKTIKSSFTFEYFVYPALCVLFNLYYPVRKNSLIKMLYLFSHSAIITVFEIILLKYTNLIKYKKWTWYWSLLTMSFTNYLSQIYFRWFFKEKGQIKK
jgi:hypothetical protein